MMTSHRSSSPEDRQGGNNTQRTEMTSHHSRTSPEDRQRGNNTQRTKTTSHRSLLVVILSLVTLLLDKQQAPGILRHSQFHWWFLIHHRFIVTPSLLRKVSLLLLNDLGVANFIFFSGDSKCSHLRLLAVELIELRGPSLSLAWGGHGGRGWHVPAGRRQRQLWTRVLKKKTFFKI